MVSVYQNLVDNNITFQDEKGLEKYVKLIQWGRGNPVGFIEQVLSVPLLDYQRWIISMTWIAEYATWVCSRNAGKSFLLGCFSQARTLLFPKEKIQIMSVVARQATETFKKMEDIAKRNISSLPDVPNTVFWDEVERPRANSDGFTHDTKTGDQVTLQNGSLIHVAVGTSKTIRGARGTVLEYDEAGSIDRDFFGVTEPFIGQDAGFKMVTDDINQDALPLPLPFLRLYVGSASDTSTYFWDKYREAFIRMLIGDTRYFVADVSCEIPLHPTRNGNPVKALLSQEEIDRKMRENEVLANREYYNIFDRFNLEDSVVSRTDIATNIDNVPPETHGYKGKKYVICYDPAARKDNAPVLVAEYYRDDETKAIRGRIVYMENLIKTYNDGSHRPMVLSEQVQRLREIVYAFNGGDKAMPYENIMLLLDNGTGGQPSGIAQELVKDWTDRNGNKHSGLLDETNEDMRRWGEAYPHAIKEHVRLLEPTEYRTKFFEAAKILVPAGNIRFPPPAPNGGVLILDTGEERKLSTLEMRSLIQTDLMKEEAVNMVGTKNASGKMFYGLPPEKKNKMHDDRNYVFVMMCWFIRQQQINDTLGEQKGVDYGAYLNNVNREKKAETVKQTAPDSWLGRFEQGSGINIYGFGSKRKRPPFVGSNPFKRR